jgi:hypothetical protein
MHPRYVLIPLALFGLLGLHLPAMAVTQAEYDAYKPLFKSHGKFMRLWREGDAAAAAIFAEPALYAQAREQRQPFANVTRRTSHTEIDKHDAGLVATTTMFGTRALADEAGGDAPPKLQLVVLEECFTYNADPDPRIVAYEVHDITQAKLAAVKPKLQEKLELLNDATQPRERRIGVGMMLLLSLWQFADADTFWSTVRTLQTLQAFDDPNAPLDLKRLIERQLSSDPNCPQDIRAWWDALNQEK